MNQIDNVLAERGKRYGDFTDHAVIAQDLQNVMRKAGVKVCGDSWDKLSAVQKQALTVIADKIARILSGDPNYDDNWIDIQGYAKLAQDRLPKQLELFDADTRRQELVPAFKVPYGSGKKEATTLRNYPVQVANTSALPEHARYMYGPLNCE